MDPALHYWSLCAVRFAIWLVELASDAVFGYTYTRGTTGERLLARQYRRSAHLVTVKWRAKYSLVLFTKEDNFLYKHDRYVHPEYVLKHGNATLMAVTDEYALFGVSDPAVDVFDTTQFPMAFVSQYTQARQLIIVPTESFHRLADDAGDPRVPVGLINMTARCGSTLLAQMFNRVPSARSVSECWATYPLHNLYCAGRVSDAENRALIRSSFRLLCKISPEEKVGCFVFKLNPQFAPQLNIISELFPKFKLIFNTRHPVPTMRSFLPMVRNMGGELNMKLGIGWRNFLASRLGFPYGDKYHHVLARFSPWRQDISHEELGLVTYVATLASYFDSKDLYHRVVLYEDLMKGPERELRPIFKLLEISPDHIPAALKALERDSKSGENFDENKKRADLSEDLLKTMDEYLEDCFVPVRRNMTAEEFKTSLGLQ